MGDLVKPSVVVEILERRGLRLTRGLGQHFLVDGNILQRLLDAADLGPGDTVLEIGPGIGTVTEELCVRASRVVAVEMDRRFASVLAEILGGRGNLELVEGDVLRVDLPAWFTESERVKVVSNLPYNIATPVIIRLLKELPQAASMTLTVQRELADRYLASPGDPSYGGVSAKINALAEVRRLANVPPTVFLPPPRVESSILRIDRKEALPAPDEIGIFFHFLDAAFSKRRKMLINSLGGGRSPYCQRFTAREALASAGFEPTTRAEELSCEELLEVFRALSTLIGQDRTP